MLARAYLGEPLNQPHVAQLGGHDDDCAYGEIEVTCLQTTLLHFQNAPYSNKPCKSQDRRTLCTCVCSHSSQSRAA